MSSKFDLGELKARNFETTSRTFLAKAHQIMLGYPPDDSDDLDVLKGKLREVAGPIGKAKVEEIKKEIEESNIVSMNTLQMSLRRMPNLGSSGKWEGKWRRLEYIKTDPKGNEDVITIRWEELKIDLIHKQVQDVPYPLYEQLLAAKEYTLIRKYGHFKDTGTSKDGRLYVEESIKEENKYNFIDHGDVPGTEDKYRDFLYYFRDVASQTKVFEGVSRTLLTKIYNICYGTTPMTALIGISDQDLRIKIASFLGPDYEQMMTEELYGSAVA